jgi:hypothetical protein
VKNATAPVTGQLRLCGRAGRDAVWRTGQHQRHAAFSPAQFSGAVLAGTDSRPPPEAGYAMTDRRRGIPNTTQTMTCAVNSWT